MTKSRRGSPSKVARIDRKKNSVVAPNAGLRVTMETVKEGAYRGLSLSFEEFVQVNGEVLNFDGPARGAGNGRRKPGGA